MKKWNIFLLLFVAFCSLAEAQIQEPIKWETSLTKQANDKVSLLFSASIDEGWHIYGMDVADGGPTKTAITFTTLQNAEVVGALTADLEADHHFDKIFEMEVSYYQHPTVFSQVVQVENDAYVMEGYLVYGACDDESCLPPTKVYFSYKGENAPAVLPAAAPSTTKLVEQADVSSLWKPVVKELHAFNNEVSTHDYSWLYIFITGFLGGLLALLTPCVWPIIPMTVSFFLKRSKDRKKGIRDAWLYGLSIIAIYLFLGLSVTILFGASALNALSTNAVFNVLFFLMLVIFAASFFGAFELALPASWSNKVDDKAEKSGGLLGIFLMAFTLTLVSFSCTGPIIGFLLVEVATSGSVVAPAVGMLGFSIALALPFTLFALFPSWLKSMPKSGGWMNIVKVTLGFIELAFAFKFLSVADLAYGWGILDRETFLSLWIVIFGLLGFYLLGKIRFPHDDKTEHVSVQRFFSAMIVLAFTVYMIPGLWGAPLKAISAFAPPMQTQDFNLYGQDVHAQFDDYEAGMAYAKRVGKPVMLDFTGYGCVNCRKMEASVWTNEKVHSLLTDDYVLITLYVDHKQSLETPITIEENGKTIRLTSVGDKWSYLQRTKFGANAQPYYVLLDNQGKPLNHSFSYDENPEHYIDFLETGLINYKK